MDELVLAIAQLQRALRGVGADPFQVRLQMPAAQHSILIGAAINASWNLIATDQVKVNSIHGMEIVRVERET